MTKFFTYILLLLCLGTVYAQIDRSQQPQPGPAPTIELGEPYQFELKNGLKVIIVENHKLPRVEVNLSLDIPPIAEGNKSGVAQLTSALIGKGSQKTAKDPFLEAIDFMGSSISFSATGATASSMSRYFDRTFELMVEGLLYPNFSEEELEKERAKLLDALKAQDKDVSAIARRVENALAFGLEHPMGEFVTPETVQGIELSDIQVFYDAYFHPNQAYLVVVGDVNAKHLKKQIKVAFKDWKAGTLKSETLAKVPNVENLQIDFVDMPNAAQTEISLQNTYNLKKNHPDYFPLIIANNILGGGGEARLFLNLREDKAFTYGAYSRAGNHKYTASRFRAFTQVRNTVVDSAVVELIGEVNRIRNERVTEEELNRVKAKYIGSFVRALEDPSTIASYALEIETENLPDDFYKNYLKQINAVTEADVQRVAQKYFKLQNARIVVTGKATDILEPLEGVQFKGKAIGVNYYNAKAEPIDRPKAHALPEGVTVATIADAYEKALGGQAAIEKLKSLKETYAMDMMGNPAQLVLKKTATQYAQEIYMGENLMAKFVITPDAAQAIQGGVPMDMDPMMEQEFRKNIGFFTELKKIRKSGVLKGVEKVDDQLAYVIEIPGKENGGEQLFFDTQTNFLIKSSRQVDMMGQKMAQEERMQNYQVYEGLWFPTENEQITGPQKVKITLSAIEINPEFTDKDFQ